MITGVVDGDEAFISLTVRGPDESETIRAVVDTGFTSYLTLPPDVIERLGLSWHSSDKGVLADGSECLFDVFEGTVDWDGKRREILVDQADTDPLVGMTLLRGYDLQIQVRPGGNVTIKRASTKRDR
jgi:clan AA aspartic protease